MKSLFNKTAISLAVLSFCGASYAVPAVSHTGMHGWFLGVDGLYAQPRNGDLDYVTVFPTTSTGNVYTKNIPQDYGWGFRLFGGLKFGDNDDVTLAWTRFHNDNSSSIGTPEGASANSVGYSLPRWLFYQQWRDIQGSVNFKLDDVSFVMGHTIQLNSPWSFRYAGGLEYARLDSNLSVDATLRQVVVADVVDYASETYGFTGTSDFRGIGPRAEFDAVYHLNGGFSLFANTNAALLVGRRDIGLETLTESGFSRYYFESDAYSSHRVIVPKVGLRLGVNYAYTFGQVGGEGACTVMNIEAGWQADTYIHAIERPDFNDGGSVSRMVAFDGVSEGAAGTKTSNFTNQGLFLGINVSTNWM